MFDAKESKSQDQFLFPRDNDMQFIPEFTVIDMRIMSSNNESEGGYGCKLQKITLHQSSLYSYLSPESLLLLPESITASSDLAVQRAQESPFIHLQLEGKNVSFFSQVPSHSFISASPVAEGYYRMVGPNGSELLPGVPCVDVALSDLLRYANVIHRESEPLDDLVMQAIKLYDFASCADALYVYVACARYFKTGDPNLGDFRGVPLINVDSFLKSVDFQGEWAEEAEITEDRIVFPFKYDIPGLCGAPIVTVWTTPVTAALLLLDSSSPPDLHPAPCPDFSLLSEDCSVTRGYLISIGNKEDPDVVRFIFNVMGCQCVTGGVQRADYCSKKRRESSVMLALKKRREETPSDD